MYCDLLTRKVGVNKFITLIHLRSTFVMQHIYISMFVTKPIEEPSDICTLVSFLVLLYLFLLKVHFVYTCLWVGLASNSFETDLFVNMALALPWKYPCCLIKLFAWIVPNLWSFCFSILNLEVRCVQGLNLWRNGSAEINDELYRGYRKGNSEGKINEIVAGWSNQYIQL